MVELIKKIIKRTILNPIREYKTRKYEVLEKNVSYGKQNPDKVFFVIRRNGPIVGLFSFVCTNIGWIKYAIDQGYIPVIDMQSIPNIYLEKKDVGKKNAWEYYFEQPCGYSLKDIRHSQNVILSDGGSPKDFPMITMYKNGNISMWRDIYKEYIRVVPDIAKEIEDETRKIKSAYRRIVGVNVRGTDYTELKPSGHPRQPSMDEAILITHEKIAEWGCDAIYLATEDEAIVDRFLQEFGDQVILPDVLRYDYRKEHNTYITQNGFNRKNDRYLRGREYLVKIGVLSNLDYIITSYMGSTYGMSLMNKEHIGEYYWDLGLYD